MSGILIFLSGVLLGAVGIIVISCMKLSGDITREEEQRKETQVEPVQKADPCNTCLRWSECNGVDRDFCPICNDGNENPKEGGNVHG